eukprot:366298-Chlamydomonas_euryale.AAC.9
MLEEPADPPAKVVEPEDVPEPEADPDAEQVEPEELDGDTQEGGGEYAEAEEDSAPKPETPPQTPPPKTPADGPEAYEGGLKLPPLVSRWRMRCMLTCSHGHACALVDGCAWGGEMKRGGGAGIRASDATAGPCATPGNVLKCTFNASMRGWAVGHSPNACTE